MILTTWLRYQGTYLTYLYLSKVLTWSCWGWLVAVHFLFGPVLSVLYIPSDRVPRTKCIIIIIICHNSRLELPTYRHDTCRGIPHYWRVGGCGGFGGGMSTNKRSFGVRDLRRGSPGNSKYLFFSFRGGMV